jgi:hypothetical protein
MQNKPIDQDKELLGYRAAFEQWANNNLDCSLSKNLVNSSRYAAVEAQKAWEIWEAGWEARTQETVGREELVKIMDFVSKKRGELGSNLTNELLGMLEDLEKALHSNPLTPE